MSQGQSKKHSWFEVWVNILVGFAINYTCNLLILPHFGFNVSYAAAFHIGLIFTVIAVIRGYVLRRVFNHFTHSSATRSQANG